MTVQEAARSLEVSIGTVYVLCRAGKLAHHRIGAGRGTIRIRTEDVAAYLDGCRVDSDQLGPSGTNSDQVGPTRPGRPSLVIRDYVGEALSRRRG